MPRASRGLDENHDRWLVSYADFVTLMFAFFVVLFAYSTVDQTKMESFAARFESYVQRDAAPLGVAPRRAAAGDPFGEQLGPDQAAWQHQALTRAEMSESIQQLEAELLPEIKSGKIELSLQPRGLVMSLREAAFFAPGDAALQAESLEVMARVARSLTKIPGQIRLEGHTDNTPIHTPKFPSNWRLSTARAITVLKFLTNRHNIPSERLAVSGYGEYRPVAPNDTPENRAKNRRVRLSSSPRTRLRWNPGETRSWTETVCRCSASAPKARSTECTCKRRGLILDCAVILLAIRCLGHSVTSQGRRQVGHLTAKARELSRHGV